jgi:hypothetical protein
MCIGMRADVPLQPTHIAAADESQYNVGRYRGLAVVTLRLADARALSADLRRLLDESGVKEFKWADLRTARLRFAADKLLTWTLEQACQRRLRVDALTWDSNERHHPLPDQSGIATLQGMYLLLLTMVLRQRWPEGCCWRICPDEQSAMSWIDLEAQLAGQGLLIEQVQPCASHEEPLVQIADLFAGLAVYSRSADARFEEWQQVADISPELLHPEEAPEPLTGSDRERYEVLGRVVAECGRYGLAVRLETGYGLRTADPAGPINFWEYGPEARQISPR